MPCRSPLKRARRKWTFLLLAFCSIQIPEQPPPVSQYRLPTSTADVAWQKPRELPSSLLSPQSLVYGLVLLALLVLGLLSAVDLVFKTVFVVCSLAVHWATYHCRIHRPPPPPTKRSSYVSVWVHGLGEGGCRLLHNVSCEAECRAVYSLVSQLLGVPSEMLTLSTGLKILQPRLPLEAYTSGVDLSHGLNLHCSLRLLGGGRYGRGSDKRVR
jgi:hypothetical protein